MKDRRMIALLIGVIVIILAAVGWMLFAPEGIEGDPTSSDPDERLAAAASLAKRDDEASVRTLVTLAADEDRRVAVRAVRSLGRQQTARSRQALEELLKSGEDDRLQGAAAAELGRYEDLDPAVLTGVLGDPAAEAEKRAGAAKGLSRLKKKESIPQLFSALKDPNPKVRLWAITALSETTGLRFNYDADVPPSRQQREIRFIRTVLKRNGHM